MRRLHEVAVSRHPTPNIHGKPKKSLSRSLRCRFRNGQALTPTASNSLYAKVPPSPIIKQRKRQYSDGCFAPFPSIGERCAGPCPTFASSLRTYVGFADSKVYVRLSVRQGFRSPHPHLRLRTSAKPLPAHHSGRPFRGTPIRPHPMPLGTLCLEHPVPGFIKTDSLSFPLLRWPPSAAFHCVSRFDGTLFRRTSTSMRQVSPIAHTVRGDTHRIVSRTGA